MGVLNYIATLLLFAGMEVASKPLMGSVDPWCSRCGGSSPGPPFSGRYSFLKEGLWG